MSHRFLKPKNFDVVKLFSNLADDLHDSRLKFKPHKNLKKNMGYLDQLLNTFPVVTEYGLNANELKLIDWNPLNQRLVIYPLRPVAKTFDGDFTRVRNIMSTYLLNIHEAAHVAMWEPFFVGLKEIKTQNDFLNMTLAFEGACFWFTDCICTPHLRRSIPDVEIVRNRTSPTNDFFPYRALKAVGADSLEKTFQIYLGAFNGKITDLTHTKDLFGMGLKKRINEFYSVSLKPIHQMYDSLSEIGVFDEFKNRFCLKGLPTFLSKSTAEIDWTGTSLERYGWKVLRSDLPKLTSIQPKLMKEIRLRRALQTRAYFALSIRNCVVGRRVFALHSQWQDQDTKKTVNLINGYLSVLESATQKLAAGQPGAATSELIRADKLFAILRKIFIRKQAWISSRNFYIPPIGNPRTGAFGLSQSGLSSKSIPYQKNDCRLVIKLLVQKDDKTISENAERLRLASEIGKRLQSPQFRSPRIQSELKRLIEKSLTLPDVLELWSVRLSDIDPQQNLFIEPAFQFV